jgi:hypothetical protein
MPVSYQNRTVSEIKIRRPKISDWKKFKERDTIKAFDDQEIAWFMLENCSSEPPEFFDHVDYAADFLPLYTKISSFLSTNTWSGTE